MRFLTPAEKQLLDSLPAVEGAVLRAFFEECDARLVEEGAAIEAAPVVHDGRVNVGTAAQQRGSKPSAAPSSTSQDALFSMRKADQ